MKINNILRKIVVSLLLCFGVYSVYSFFYTKKTYNDCGIVVSHSNDEVPIKYGTKTELYLNIQFDSSGFKSILVEPTTYFKYKNGERICFDLPMKFNLFKEITYIIGFFITIIIAFICVVLFLAWLFGANMKIKF
jgi:hypothetical protein